MAELAALRAEADAPNRRQAKTTTELIPLDRILNTGRGRIDE